MAAIAIDELGPSLLFCPGDRPERFERAAMAADNAILDLEDGTAAANKDRARDDVCAYISRAATPPIVRINLPGTERGVADAKAVLAAGARALIVPKTESGADIAAVASCGPAALIAIVETAKGVEAAAEILAHPALAGISWGPYDLSADMGMRRVRDGRGDLLPALALARDRLLIAAAAARKIAIDTVTAEIKDLDLLAREANAAADAGFRAKLCIHPTQIPVIRAAFRPSEAEVDRARRILAEVKGRGAFTFEGELIDEPILRRARHLIRLAEKAAASAA